MKILHDKMFSKLIISPPQKKNKIFPSTSTNLITLQTSERSFSVNTELILGTWSAEYTLIYILNIYPWFMVC